MSLKFEKIFQIVIFFGNHRWRVYQIWKTITNLNKIIESTNIILQIPKKITNPRIVAKSRKIITIWMQWSHYTSPRLGLTKAKPWRCVVWPLHSDGYYPEKYFANPKKYFVTCYLRLQPSAVCRIQNGGFRCSCSTQFDSCGLAQAIVSWPKWTLETNFASNVVPDLQRFHIRVQE